MSGRVVELQFITKAQKGLQKSRITEHKAFVAEGKTVNGVFYVQVLGRLLARVFIEGQFVSVVYEPLHILLRQ
jgi:hypothetical protein